MDERLRKIIVGLALEGEFSYGRFNQRLFDLYRNPNLKDIRDLHDRLKNSNSPHDREVAIWLGLTLEQKPYHLDTNDLLVELWEMEWLLYHMLQEVDDASKQDLNDWMNYLINAAHSIEDDRIIDAKICMNLALDSAMKGSIQSMKREPSLEYLVNLLQIETLRRYKQIRELPFTPEIGEERIDSILEVQDIIVELMRRRQLRLLGEEIEEIATPILSRLSEALRYLMRSDVEVKKARDELIIASKILGERNKEFSSQKRAEEIEQLNHRIKRLISAAK